MTIILVELETSSVRKRVHLLDFAIVKTWIPNRLKQILQHLFQIPWSSSAFKFLLILAALTKLFRTVLRMMTEVLATVDWFPVLFEIRFEPLPLLPPSLLYSFAWAIRHGEFPDRPHLIGAVLTGSLSSTHVGVIDSQWDILITSPHLFSPQPPTLPPSQ